MQRRSPTLPCGETSGSGGLSTFTFRSHHERRSQARPPADCAITDIVRIAETEMPGLMAIREELRRASR